MRGDMLFILWLSLPGILIEKLSLRIARFGRFGFP
jgi:hypothetical protein